MSKTRNFEHHHNIEEDSNIKFLKDHFSLDDFLDFNETRELLYNDFVENYENGCEKEIEDFYERETKFCNQTLSTAFACGNEQEHLGSFLALVFRNIEPKYNLNIFYDEPKLAENMVLTYNNRLEKMHNNKLKKRREKILKNNRERGNVFDLSTKSFSDSLRNNHE